MEERLDFYGSAFQVAEVSINQGVELTFHVHSGLAESFKARWDQASSLAQAASNLIPFQFLVEEGFVNRGIL